MSPNMTLEDKKTIPLPSGPPNLCFDKDEFMKDNFDVDKFVIECRRRVQLETLRDDLTVYLKILRNAMIELINKDYADFVNLSTNLVGMDKAIDNLSVPLGQFREEISSVRDAMDDAVKAVEEKLAYKQQIKAKKACLQRLMNITHSVDKIEKLLQINQSQTENQVTQAETRQLSGQLIERVATEFNKLQFYVTKSKGLPLVEKVKPRIANITTTLQYSLEELFIDGLEKGNVDMLRQCLRTYALIDKIRDAENLFRQHIVKPYMEIVISERSIENNSKGLDGMFESILEFVPKHCKILKDVTSGTAHSGEVVRGYDFLVNSVWPEIVSNLEARTPLIFSPGNPDVFHQKYLTSIKFLEDFEKLCGCVSSVKRLRSHPSYEVFMHKWNLPVYYQIRFQDIAGVFEASLLSGFSRVTDDSLFHLQSTDMLWYCLQKCWTDQVYLPTLCHKFWKLTLQLLSRYSTWLREVYETEIKSLRKPKNDRLEKTADMHRSSSSPQLSNMNGDDGQQRVPLPHSETQAAFPTEPVTNGQIICAISDAEKLSDKIIILFLSQIKPRIETLGVQDMDSFKESLTEARENILSALPPFKSFLTEDICELCAIHIKQVNDIPRLYRRTNREVPSKSSSYINSLLKPVKIFLEEHGDYLSDKERQGILRNIFSSIAEQYYSVTSDVLTSVKKMEESLKRLKKARGTEKSGANQGMSDDDKIRQQLIVDIDAYGEQIKSFGVVLEDISTYQKLLELSEDAKASMSLAPSEDVKTSSSPAPS